MSDAADASYGRRREAGSFDLGFLRDVRDRGRNLQTIDDAACLDAFVACEEDAEGCLSCVMEMLEVGTTTSRCRRRA